MIKTGTFTKNDINTDFYNEQYYTDMFNSFGFNPSSINICFTNGVSAYVSINCKVLKSGKLPYDAFIWEDMVSLTVRVSDHSSNLERFGGADGNKISMSWFEKLVNLEAIEQK